jgi:hypothetical protein
MEQTHSTSCNFCAIPRNAVIRRDFVELGAFELISAFGSRETMGSSPKSYYRLAKNDFLVQI